MKPLSVAELVAARIAAKREEDAAVKARREIDASIAELMRVEGKAEGSVSQKLDGFKVTVTYKIDRKVDTDKLQDSWSKLSAGAANVFRWKADVIVSELRKLEPADAAAASVFITAKEASPSITIEAI